jgi:DMSO/TMAO reductase YedYZ molybdopterin-dependent catalytic subunit
MPEGTPNEVDYDAERAEEWRWRWRPDRGIDRRRFLELAALAGLGAATAACDRGGRSGTAGPSTLSTATTAAAPADAGVWVKPVTDENFVVRHTNAEMRWERMAGQGDITPNSLFFVRNHLKTSRIDRAAWRLQVAGDGVEQPLELSYDDLRKLGAETTVRRFVECAGNGRVFFDEVGHQKAEGTQWRLGAIGVADWTGVPLGAVLERAKVKKGARHVMPEGLDELKVRRAVPIGKAMADDTLLVYAMNGEDLPADHGGPVRALVPGWIGVANVKWVGRIEVSEQPLLSDWNTTSYVLLGPGYATEGPAKGPVLSTQSVKSALELPWPATLPAGSQTIRGRSWSGQGRIAKVECRIDDGPWQAARTEGSNEPLAWARWSLAWDATPGSHTVRVKATDERGNTQPETVPFNQQGYLYGGIVAHPVTISA